MMAKCDRQERRLRVSSKIVAVAGTNKSIKRLLKHQNFAVFQNQPTHIGTTKNYLQMSNEDKGVRPVRLDDIVKYTKREVYSSKQD